MLSLESISPGLLSNSQLPPDLRRVCLLMFFIFTIMSISNPYALQIMQQTGCTEREAHKSNPSSTREFPCVIHGRLFDTEADYQEALAEFLNGN